MSESTATVAEVRQLDSGYSRETRTLLYQVYRQEPSFEFLFNAAREGLDKRVKTTVREWVKQHFLQDLPAIGLFIEDRLVGVALITPPRRRLGITESWAWRLRMVLKAGFNCTRRYLTFYNSVLACLPSQAVHVLPLLGVHPEFQGQQLSEQLLKAVNAWCAEDETSQGVVLNTGNPRYVQFYREQGYEEVGEIAVGPVVEHVFFHPHQRISQPAVA